MLSSQDICCLAFPDALGNKDEECEEHLAQHEETAHQMVEIIKNSSAVK